MRSRCVVAAVVASLVAAVSSGCVLRTEKIQQRTARVTVGGTTRTSHAVSCSQVQWLWTADISVAPARVRVLLRLGRGKPEPQSVNIDHFEGFTGVADSGVGKAAAVFADNTYIVRGTAQGTDPDNPTTPATADFTIEVSC
ncbi:lipoprotein LpqH [Mycobacterium sp.]|uniref:lipoprotein LpqH n=1 Tax=Mycobacterium sp. TaxID=1785 RepID=UPI0031DC9C01